MEEQDIVDAFDAQLMTLTLPGLTVAWQGLPFTPVEGQPYLSPALSAYVPTPVGAGADSVVQHDGSYTVVVRASANDGRAFASQIAAAVRQLFKRGTALSAAGVPLIVLTAAQRPAVEAGDWIMVPVEVSFTASAPP